MTGSGYRLVQLQNGVHSVHSLRHDETFHPVIGPVAEAEALYVRQLRLRERLARHAGEFVIWDVGLGAAANAVTVLRATRDIACPIRIVSFDHTLEPLRFALQHRAELGYLEDHAEPVRRLLDSGGATRRVAFRDGARDVEWTVRVADFPTWVACAAHEPEGRAACPQAAGGAPGTTRPARLSGSRATEQARAEQAASPEPRGKDDCRVAPEGMGTRSNGSLPADCGSGSPGFGASPGETSPEPASCHPCADAGAAPHAILFDAFSPATNPEMWTLPLFSNLFRLLDPVRPCAMPTYSRSTMLRVTLLLAGFRVGAGHATGEKEETTIAANLPELIEEPLGRTWLLRARRSTSAEPLQEAVYRQAPMSGSTWERLQAHPQFHA